MLQQSSRYILKAVKSVRKGKKVVSLFDYINNIEALLKLKSGAKTVEDLLEPEHLLQAMSVRAAFALKRVYDMLDQSDVSEKEKQNDLMALDILKMTRHHMNYMLALMAWEKKSTYHFRDFRIRPILDTLLKIFIIKELQTDLSHLYETGFFGPGAGALLDEGFKLVLQQLRPHMVNLVETSQSVETYNISFIGNKHGDIYEKQLEHMMGTKLNEKPRPRYYEKYMKPVMTHPKL